MFSDSLAIWREWGMICMLYVGECAGSRSVGRPWKRWVDTAKGCFKKKEVWVSGKQEQWCIIEVNGGTRVCEGKCLGSSLKGEPLTLARCHS